MQLFGDFWGWLGQKGIYAIAGASFLIILVTNFTLKYKGNLLVISIYDFLNMAIFIGLAVCLYFISYICADLDQYGFFKVFKTVFFLAAPSMLLFIMRSPLFLNVNFNIFEHVAIPVLLALMISLMAFPVASVARKFIGI
jgi:hypothetical protein